MYTFFTFNHIKNGDTMEGIIQVIIRALVSFVILFIVTKMIGKKQVSELSIFDYVIGISIGNFAAELTLNLDTKIIHAILAVTLFGLISYVISILTMKSIILRRFFVGVPTIIIQDGILLEKSLKKVKMDVNDLLEECRLKGYFDISEIAYAVLEANGDLSILPKAENKPVTIKDSGLKKEKSALLSNVIIDSNIMINNLNNIGKDKEWLLKKLKEKGKNLEDILLATIDNNEKLLIYEKTVKNEKDTLE